LIGTKVSQYVLLILKKVVLIQMLAITILPPLNAQRLIVKAMIATLVAMDAWT
jgi:hypothetical protein